MPASKLQEQVERFRKQQGVLAAFGKHALRTNDLDELLHGATRHVSDALEVDLVKILELLPGGRSLLVRAGVNWAPGVVGHAIIGAHIGSSAGFALQSGQPVISPDIDKEKRFEIPEILRTHGVKSTVNVMIQGDRPPFGVLEVDDTHPRDFSQDDINFLQNYANLLAAAIERVWANEELAEAARMRSILLRELQHRNKNMLMRIQALANRTRSSSDNVDQFLSAFNARLQALARAQDLLTRGTTDIVSLREIVTEELQTQNAVEDRVTVRGDNSQVLGKDAWALHLLFYELTTNAQKHGALHTDNGKIDVFWKRDDQDHKLTIRWKETSSNSASKPNKKGFGSEIIQDIVPETLGGSSKLTFQPDGLECIIEFPAAALNH